MSLEWIAGFFDGEGSIYATYCQNKYGTRFPQLRIAVANTDKESLEPFKQFGASICKRKRRTLNDKVIYEWHLSGRSALRFLRAIADYSITKRKHIEVVLSLWERAPWYCREKLRELNRRGKRRHQSASR